jgi:hypothetical protein
LCVRERRIAYFCRMPFFLGMIPCAKNPWSGPVEGTVESHK